MPSVSFKQEIFIPFHYVDAAGILFFGHTFTLAHQVFESFVVQALCCSWAQWFQNPSWIVPIKNAEASFQAPLLAGLSCQVQLSIEEIKQSSFSVHYEFIQNDQLCCMVKTIHVFCNRQSKDKLLIPNEIKSQLELYF
ncbi:acyl-CoA thioesterase [Candidatus Protochlamydia amoebophila]|uniref:1,4-dihydroxy-2-naphthoyl-CoA hydrolase n=1 Tax=Candidatus Protochlamydia amoebophila TaxID=362787 RepID=A0A0C1JJL1_9BACT|nr:acyl-CoA thioesterase [Candidatus Protochlamydia amoebophila]KIC71530.1 hypothetical protein DB44_DJ00250 [Candidatus Protochlamydia amoebophila]